MANILLVDDDESLLRLLQIRLRAAGHEVSAHADPRQALAAASARDFDLVITDLRMPGMDGMALQEALRADRPTVPVIMLTAHGTIPDAVAATRAGVFSFLTKPFESGELLDAVQRALGAAGGDPALPADDADALAVRTGIVTRSPVMKELLRQAALAAVTDVPVLVLGESGTGKELMARAIHQLSPRAQRPFAGLNCAALPEALFESELFGHERGAFTGAQTAHPGIFRASEGGTVFLDEIGDMPVAMQPKFLRVLQDREVRPVGSLRAFPVNVRIVSATHRQLDERIGDERFRADLYYRLRGLVLKLPSLSERREDIAPLAQRFLADLDLPAADGQRRRAQRSLAPDALDMLVSAAWPGNVRQLRNVVQQAAVLTPGDVVPAATVAAALEQRADDRMLSFDDARRDFERDYLARVLRATGGNVTRAAQLAQRNRQDFYKLMKRNGLEPSMFKE